MSVTRDVAVPLKDKVAMRVENTGGQTVLHLSIDREVLGHLADGHDLVTVLGSDLNLDPSVITKGVRYVTIHARSVK
ncbi:hypothetical protein [Streptomyces vinaceus]|uniref:hypothetical protein n=1 Tax=Streptomyces vinaceus TaxID=1960 RepID=UPI00368C9BC0